MALARFEQLVNEIHRAQAIARGRVADAVEALCACEHTDPVYLSGQDEYRCSKCGAVGDTGHGPWTFPTLVRQLRLAYASQLDALAMQLAEPKLPESKL